MARKPVPGSDGNNWGTILNEYLDALAADKADVATVTAVQADVAALKTDVRIVKAGGDIASALATHQHVQLEAGTYTVTATITLNANQMLTGRGRGKTIIKAADGADIENVIAALNKEGIVLRDLTVDANHQGRTAALDAANRRTLPVSLSGCAGALVENVTAKNARGNGTIPGVGIAVTGHDCRVLNCRLEDCGVAGKAADGVFSSGDRMLIQGCIAVRCTDTAFVLERTNYATIADCIAYESGCGAGISHATANNYRGNSIRGLTVYDWSASNTGGVQILTAGSGNVYDTSIADVTMVQTGPGLVGSAIMMRETSTGKLIGVTIDNVLINGADDHGINLKGENVTVTGGQIRNVNTGGAGAACIRVDATAKNVQIKDVTMVPVNPIVAAVSVTGGAANIAVDGCDIDCTGGTNYGVYFYGSVTNARAMWNEITNIVSGYVGSDAGTAPYVLWRDNTVLNSGILFGKERDTNLYRGGANILQTNDTFAAPSVAVGSVAVSSRAAIYSGSGTPEGVVAARLGSIYLNIAGGAVASLWVKESGQGLNTGWVAK